MSSALTGICKDAGIHKTKRKNKRKTPSAKQMQTAKLRSAAEKSAADPYTNIYAIQVY